MSLIQLQLTEEQAQYLQKHLDNAIVDSSWGRTPDPKVQVKRKHAEAIVGKLRAELSHWKHPNM